MQELMTLESESLEVVYGAFMEAFSDYSVPVSWSFEEFRASCLRRGVDLSISLGAREEGRLVGFVLNGRGTWAGAPAVYDTEAAAARRDWEPSWQNSDDSVRRAVEPLVVLEARFEGRSAGRLIASRNGTIWQLAADQDLRGRGIGTALLRTLASRTDSSIRYVNVQSDDGATLGLLRSCGIGPGVGHYEMVREL